MTDDKAYEGTRTVRWDDPRIGPEAAGKSSGVELIRAMIEGEVPHPPCYVLLGLSVTQAAEGRIVMQGTPGEHMLHPGGGVHGAFAATLIESATGLAVWSLLPVGQRMTTLDIKVNYVRPMTQGMGVLTCEAKLVHPGRRIALAEAQVTSAEGKLIAHGTSTCMVFA